VLDASGRPWVKFGRLQAGRSARLVVNVRNNGALPAMARLEMERHEAFTLLEGPQVREGCAAARALAGSRAPPLPPALSPSTV
jgi:hypothetical protein